ncbi:MAG: NAD-dependent epimerase/dehydratase family protein [Vicingaceae bacterium]
MKTHLVSGGCGFVGRNMVNRLFNSSQDRVLFIDDLSVGIHPDKWIGQKLIRKIKDIEIYGEDERLVYIPGDFRDFLRKIIADPAYLKKDYDLEITSFADVFHFAAIVGGRAKIDGDPMMVALDLSIDAEFFYWVCRQKPERVLYPSSSAAYPVNLQTDTDAIALRESDIDFNNMGQPDMTYGWSKLTGEYLAHIAAKYYGVHVTCIRPFSGYGEDQDLTYPVPAIAARAANKENPFEVWGTGKQGRDFVHIDDVLDCTLLAMDHISDGTSINIGMGKLTTFLEIIDIFTSFAGYKPTIKPLLDKPVGVHSRYCNMDFVKEKLDWEAKISTEEGMRRVYERHLQNTGA